MKDLALASGLFPEMTGNVDNAMFSQVGFVHKKRELELLAVQAQLRRQDKLALDRVSVVCDLCFGRISSFAHLSVKLC